MKIWERSVLFYLGGAGYMTLEFLWRGRSDGSMFLLGGGCFMVLGQLGRLRLSRPVQAVIGAGAVTALELLTGLAVNREYAVWDYRGMPLNLRGQICLPYSLLWVPVSFLGIALYRKAEGLLKR